MNLADVRQLAFALPDVTEEPHFQRTSFRVGGKIIATALADEPFLNVMLGDNNREPVLAVHPAAVEKLYWGKKVMGLRVDLRAAQVELVAELLELAWQERAPKSLQSTR